MLWPTILPFQITLCLLAAFVIAGTFAGSCHNRKRLVNFWRSLAIGIVAFVPSCVGVQSAVDSARFGDFHHDSYHDIGNFRFERYMPDQATNIQMRKHSNGYFARYTISKDEFHKYLDGLWSEHGAYSSVQRGDPGRTDPEHFGIVFQKLDWVLPEGAIVYSSPTERDGGGATYFFDAKAKIAFQRTGFW